MKKVLLVYAQDTMELLNRKAALGSYIHCLCTVLQKNGYDISVNGIPFTKLNGEKNAAANDVQRKSFVRFLPRILKESIKNLFLFRRINVLYNSLAGKREYDVILEFYSYGSNAGAKLSRETRTPLVLVFDAPVLEAHRFFHGSSLLDAQVRTRQRESLRQAYHVVVYSNPVKQYVVKSSGRSNNIHIHQNVDFTRFDVIKTERPASPVNIGFVGSFLAWHKVDLLIDAFEKVRAKGINAKLILVGDGMERKAIEAQVDRSTCRNDISMPGFMDGAELLECKKKMHIGVMPGSNWYGAPNKIFEYGAAGMAVVAPATPTIKDIFSNEILLFEEGNVWELAGHLEKLCRDRQMLHGMAAALQEKILSTYSEERTYHFYDELLSNAIQEKKSNKTPTETVNAF